MDFIDFFSLSASGDLSFTWAIIITQWAKNKNKRACFLVAFNKKKHARLFSFFAHCASSGKGQSLFLYIFERFFVFNTAVIYLPILWYYTTGSPNNR